MRSLFTRKSLILQPGQVVSGIAGRSRALHVRQGRVWLTVEGVSHDYWLSAGDMFTALPGRLTVIEADGVESRIEVACAVHWPGRVLAMTAYLASRLALRRASHAGCRLRY